MPRLFHVSDGAPLTRFVPRPSPPGTPYAGQLLVWAVDEDRLPNYLVPRECPRACWAVRPDADGILASTARRVVVVEQDWLPRLAGAGLQVHELDPDGFRCLDESAGYWVSDRETRRGRRRGWRVQRDPGCATRPGIDHARPARLPHAAVTRT